VRHTAAVVLACLFAVPAAAQDATQPVTPPVKVTAAPLRPLGGPAAAAPVSALSPSAASPSAQPSAPANGGAPAFTPAPAAPQAWLPRGTAEVQALDKVNARNTTLSVKVGQSATFGSLTIKVQACMVRPPDQPQDAAAFLVITDSHEGQPGFSGWMVAAAPSASMLQNPIYDIRVTGCST
jgi:hypothetical protein